MKWPTISLGNLCVSMSSGGTPPSNVAEYYGGDIPWLRTQEVVFNRIRSTELFITEKGLQNSAAKWISAPAVVVAMYGNSAGRSAISEIPLTTNQACCNLVVDGAKADFRFVFYQLVMRYEELKGLSKGAAQNNLNAAQVREFKIGVPPLPTQRRIAEILSAYDDLIENNQRRMKLLEESARLLHQEWFVHLRFPGHEHTKIVDGVPEGWARIPASSAIEINPKTPLPDKPFHTFIEMSDLMTDSMVIQGTAQREGRSGSKFRNGDTLFARITPRLENGKTGFVNCLEEGEVGRGSTEFIVLRGHRVGPEFVYCLARTYGFREIAIKSMTGSSGRQRANESCFDKFLLNVPPTRVHAMFCDNVLPLFTQIKCLSGENSRLRAARDLLLPRLMSGEIEV